MAGTYVAGPNTHLVEDAILGVLQTAGLPAERAGWIAFALGYYVFGPHDRGTVPGRALRRPAIARGAKG
ncbi:hypothetical protein [Frankia gtarii]|uniref:hypothetical protein n=1 Tax=Frankia gtarii TaxID=2950102 RepID=UPI0021BF2B88|nr:hypothetical protein [Frankia gtarii]